MSRGEPCPRCADLAVPQTITQLMEVWELRALAAGRDSESRAFPAGFVGRRAAAGFPPLLVAASYGFLFLFIF